MALLVNYQSFSNPSKKKKNLTEALPNSFYKSSINPDNKTRQVHYKKRKPQPHIPDEHRSKKPQ